jgi:hypothetical protein
MLALVAYVEIKWWCRVWVTSQLNASSAINLFSVFFSTLINDDPGVICVCSNLL